MRKYFIASVGNAEGFVKKRQSIEARYLFENINGIDSRLHVFAGRSKGWARG